MTDLIARTHRMNRLFDKYRPLLTEKQQTFLELYYHEDYSLGEIAENYRVSRQAVYEHIKRASEVLEELESKLRLVYWDDQWQRMLTEIEHVLRDVSPDKRDQVMGILHKWGR